MTRKRSSAGVERRAIEVGGSEIEPGQRQRIEIRVARFVTGEWVSLPVEVIHGAQPGPVVWMSGAIHGDELDGVEIARVVSAGLSPAELRGTVFSIPIVNIFGFIQASRYLPDRRDLNRSFPGSAEGSMAGRLAWLFTTEIVDRSDWGIDLHCGSGERENLPQIRCDLTDPETRAVAEAFSPALLIDNKGPEGSLRRVALERGARVLVYEGGEAGRFTPASIRSGIDGTLRMLHTLGMIDEAPPAAAAPRKVSSTHWVRASRSGIIRLDVELGDEVRKGRKIGEITEILGGGQKVVRASNTGMVMGRRVSPLVYQGEALVHIARLDGGAREGSGDETRPDR
ncbi:MAG: succinylglutamate desuccinylase/aspartoacylase family protein [Longimicrobiales bacterium]|nr:succinylglutamate desuccinylase/aspartoacylase family protein [Longimicrobiales bacterium]